MKEVEKLIKTQKQHIYFLLVFVMIAWGLNVIATKILVTTFEPVTVTSLRIFTASMAVFIILFFLRKIRIPTKKELTYILLGGLFNVVFHHYFLSIGLSKTSASNGGLILGLGPILTTIAAFMFLGNTVTKLRLVGILLGFLGVSFIVMDGDSSISGVSIGDFYVFLSIIAQAISFVIIKKISTTLDPRLMTGYMLFFGSIILFVISLFTEPQGLVNVTTQGSLGVWLIFFASAVIATGIGHMTYNFAIGKVGVAETAIFINLNPFFTLVSAAIFLREQITFSQVFGFIFILFGVLFGSGAIEEYIRHSKQKQKEIIEVEDSA
jgi:drug/metabolite transporter (DMT)-like permease